MVGTGGQTPLKQPGRCSADGDTRQTPPAHPGLGKAALEPHREPSPSEKWSEMGGKYPKNVKKPSKTHPKPSKNDQSHQEQPKKNKKKKSKKKKSRLSYFYNLIVLMHFVPVELFILEIKKQMEIFVAYSRGPPRS